MHFKESLEMFITEWKKALKNMFLGVDWAHHSTVALF